MRGDELEQPEEQLGPAGGCDANPSVVKVDIQNQIEDA